MGDKIRGAFAILVGAWALYQSYVLFQAHRVDWHLWLEIAAGLVLISLGVWRVQRQSEDSKVNAPKSDLPKAGPPK
jgi:ABC-type nickel/cobalt efflux system permease component RcnA